MISCETSADLHSKRTRNHALRGKGGSDATQLQKRPNFPFCPYRSADVRLGKVGSVVAVRSAHKILTNVSAHFDKPKQSPGLSCEGSRDEKRKLRSISLNLICDRFGDAVLLLLRARRAANCARPLRALLSSTSVRKNACAARLERSARIRVERQSRRASSSLPPSVC